MGNRVILATIIVGVALMMLFSAVAPAMAAQGGEKGPPEDICTKLFNKFLAKFGLERTLELLAKMGCV